MKKFTVPQYDLVLIDANDVIVTSGCESAQLESEDNFE